MSKIKWARPPVGGPIRIDNCAAVTILWANGSAVFHNNFHASLVTAGPLNPTVAETIFSAIKANAATTAYLAKVHPTYTLAGVHVKDLRAYNNPTIASSGAAIPGTSAGQYMPTDVALAVTLRTQYSGRGFAGRIYLPGITQDNLADQRHWISTTAFQNLVLNFMNAINSAMTTNIGSWVLGRIALAASPDPGAPPPYNQPRPADTIPIQKADFADFRVDSQRKRLGR